MSRLSAQDWRAVSACIERLYACRSLAEFPLLACVELAKVIQADNTTFNYVASSIDRYVAAWAPDLGRFEERVRLTAELLPCHPVARHQLQTGDGSARLISDFCTRSEFHALPIYDRLYREMAYEDQLAFLLFPLGSEMIAMAFARDRRSFTARDRAVSNLLRPHVGQAYRNAEAFSRLDRNPALPAWTREVLRVTSVTLDDRGRPKGYGTQAGEWFERFLGWQRGDGARFPAEVEQWLQRCRESDGLEPVHARPLVRARAGERLSLRYFGEVNGTESMLVLELDTLVAATTPLRRAGLSAREVEVLRHLEHGLTNLEIAAKLGISAHTVRAHLEHVFAKLGVTNRTAAITRMRQLAAR